MVIDIHISKYFTEQYGIWRNRKWLICRSRMMELRNLRSFLLALWAPVNLRIIRRLATTSAFKLLRLVFSVFQTVYWHANGTAKQVREAERPENYRRSAQVLTFAWCTSSATFSCLQWTISSALTAGLNLLSACWTTITSTSCSSLKRTLSSANRE